jgi:(hydroxyamino)benzene mutase
MTVQNGGGHILIHGMVFVLVGLVWGLVVPNTPYPRLALTAHVQLESNGMLFTILGVLLLKLPHSVGSRSVWVMLLAVWLTWLMALSEVANSWWGTTQILPIAARQAGASGGSSWQELVVKLSHISAGLVLIVAWSLLIVGFVRRPGGAKPAA